MFVGTKIPMWIMITALLASEYIATMEMKSEYSALPYASGSLRNSVFTISFFSSKLNMYDKIISLFFLQKMTFCRTKTPFYERPPVLFQAF